MPSAQSKFHDMEMRVINAAGDSDFRIEFRNPGACWPYGRLYLYKDSDKRYALFGDLRIQVSIEESLRLCEIAELRRTGIMSQFGTTTLAKNRLLLHGDGVEL